MSPVGGCARPKPSEASPAHNRRRFNGGYPLTELFFRQSEKHTARFALPLALDYDPCLQSAPTTFLACDGCGQSVSPEHIARRLQRLEWTTRYRPVHIGTLLLSGVSPETDEHFLYAGKFAGEAGQILAALGISTAGKPPEVVLAEFQRGGFFVTHLLECPLEASQSGQPSCDSLFLQRVAPVMARIRRSLKPKRIVLISEQLAPLTARLSSAELGCPVILDNGMPFNLSTPGLSVGAQHLREVLTAVTAGL